MPTAADLKVINPSSREELALLPQDSKESAIKKLETAHDFFQETKTHMPSYQRMALLGKLASALDEQQQDFAATIAKEGGKPLRDAKVEVSRAIAGIRSAISYLHEHDGRYYPLSNSQSTGERRGWSQAFPIGPMLSFSAFNHPLNLIVHQAVPAFAAGCPCVIKPAPDTPLSCINFVKLMWQYGIPKSYIDVVVTDDLSVAQALLQHLHSGFFSFIGSAKVGWMLRSQLNPGVRCALEHGGIAPSVLTSTADLATAIPDIVKGAFYHAGQVCVSTQRLFVHASQYQDTIDALAEQTDKLITGDASDEKTDVGPLIRTSEVNRVNDWVDEAIKADTDVLIGGEAIDASFFAPTVLLNPSHELNVSQMEIFGPVLCVYFYTELDAVIEQANATPFAFQASIFSNDIDEIEYVYQHINASAVMVNDHTAYRDDAMPFAGLKQSGLGVGGIPYTIEDLTYQKCQFWKKSGLKK